jgi:hypothetical protein
MRLFINDGDAAVGDAAVAAAWGADSATGDCEFDAATISAAAANASAASSLGTTTCVNCGVVGPEPDSTAGLWNSAGIQPAGGAMSTMLLHRGQAWISPIRLPSRTLSRAWHVSQMTEKGSTERSLRRVEIVRAVRPRQQPQTRREGFVMASPVYCPSMIPCRANRAAAARLLARIPAKNRG